MSGSTHMCRRSVKPVHVYWVCAFVAAVLIAVFIGSICCRVVYCVEFGFGVACEDAALIFVRWHPPYMPGDVPPTLMKRGWTVRCSGASMGAAAIRLVPRARLTGRQRYVVFPLWIPLFLCVCGCVLLRRDRGSVLPGKCVACGYDLRGNISGRCPECGAPAR